MYYVGIHRYLYYVYVFSYMYNQIKIYIYIQIVYDQNMYVVILLLKRNTSNIVADLYTQFIFNMLTSRKFVLKNENLESIKACLCKSIFLLQSRYVLHAVICLMSIGLSKKQDAIQRMHSINITIEKKTLYVGENRRVLNENNKT